MKKFLLLTSIVFSLVACTQNPYKISNEAVGSLKKTDTLRNILETFTTDSISIDSLRTGEIVGLNTFDNNKQLSLKIRSNFYGLPEVVQVFDKRFTTPEGVGVGSTFADVQKKYNIIRITPSIRSVSVAVKDKPFIFLIDKNELPESLRYTMQPIEAVQIGDNVPISQVLISW
jgi:hypothetical protein